MANSRPSRAVKLFGTDSPAGKITELTAGMLTATFDGGAVRNIRYCGVEVLRGINFLVRDGDWGTYSPAIKQLKLRQRPDGFDLKYAATCKDRQQEIHYETSIAADASGWLMFVVRAAAITDFRTNRTGFVVLHPLDGVAGKPVYVTHSDGSREKARFPKFISPGQPIFEISSLRHVVVPGVSALVEMQGGKFEMEDHRNWMDASYKTYVRPLSEPWPYLLQKNKSFTQSVALRMVGKPTQRSGQRASDVVKVTIGAMGGRLPSIGSGIPMKESNAALMNSNLIAEARLTHLVCQVDGRCKGLVEAARSFSQLKDRTKIPITLEVILPAVDTAAAEAAAIAAACREGGLIPDAVVITQSYDLKSFQPNTPHPGPGYEEMAFAARAAFPGTRLGGGMLSYFTELNRKRPALGLFDFITHTACPTVHAADDVSVMQTLESLPWIFTSTRALIGKTPYHMGPTAIPCRDNPYGSATAINPTNDRMCLAETDPRQRSLFGAAWSLGLVAAATKAGVESIALGAAVGPQGAIYSKTAQRQPWFDAEDGKLYPIYHILAGLAPAANARCFQTVVDKPSSIAALTLNSQSGRVAWLANLTSTTQKIKISGMTGSAVLHVLDERSFVPASKDSSFLSRNGSRLKSISTIELSPYAVARIQTS